MQTHPTSMTSRRAEAPLRMTTELKHITSCSPSFSFIPRPLSEDPASFSMLVLRRSDGSTFIPRSDGRPIMMCFDFAGSHADEQYRIARRSPRQSV